MRKQDVDVMATGSMWGCNIQEARSFRLRISAEACRRRQPFSPDKSIHSPIDTRQLPGQKLQGDGQDVVPFDPAGVKGHGDDGTLAAVDGGDDFLGHVDGFDDGGEEAIGGPDAVEERGVELAGGDEDHADVGVGFTQLGGQRAVHGHDAGLGGGVVGQTGGAQVADDGSDVDDGAATAGADEGWEEGLETVQGAQEVGGQAGIEFVEGEVQEGFSNDDGGVIDENGGGAKLMQEQGIIAGSASRLMERR